MRVLSLKLENIGPFDRAELEFVADPEKAQAPVTLLTGLNGTGKTIILDAIRGMFGGGFCVPERRLWRTDVPFRVELTIDLDRTPRTLVSTKSYDRRQFDLSNDLGLGVPLWDLPSTVAQGQEPAPNWVVDYWRTALGTGSYEIRSLVAQDHTRYLLGALQGTLESRTITELVSHFDYLRDSRSSVEKLAGEVLYERMSAIIKASLLDGELSHVERSTFTPMIKQGGQLVPLENLSSGNAYLIQHMISMLGKMYAVHVLRGTDPSEIGTTPGVLLIDEAENQLHPAWQKRFFRIIHEIFPNLQIIATTHSPFIVAAAPDARVYVCRYERERRACVVEDRTDFYANKPVDEILVSDAFDHTQPFGEEVSDLIEARRSAIERGDVNQRKQIEGQLKARNPDYFSYFDVDEHLRALGAAQ